MKFVYFTAQNILRTNRNINPVLIRFLNDGAKMIKL